jgi:hypothetical protein
VFEPNSKRRKRAPDIVTAILAGKQPAELTAKKLMADTRLPLDWRQQRAVLDFATARDPLAARPGTRRLAPA